MLKVGDKLRYLGRVGDAYYFTPGKVYIVQAIGNTGVDFMNDVNHISTWSPEAIPGHKVERVNISKKYWEKVKVVSRNLPDWF